MAELKELWALLADPALKAYYRMEADALTTDSSGQGKTLTNNNSVGEATGKYGGAADFGTANTNKSLSIADALGYATGTGYSFSCWVKIRTELSGADDYRVLVNNSESLTDSMLQLMYNRISGVNKVQFQRYKNGIGAAGVVSKDVNLGTTDWHHIVGVYDGSNVNLYVDNVAVGNVAAPNNGNNGASDAFAIGANIALVQYINAYIDDVACFAKALSAAEVSLLYNNLAATQNYLTNYRGRKRTTGAVSI